MDERSCAPLNVNVGGICYNQCIPPDPDPLPTSIWSNVRLWCTWAFFSPLRHTNRLHHFLAPSFSEITTMPRPCPYRTAQDCQGCVSHDTSEPTKQYSFQVHGSFWHSKRHDENTDKTYRNHWLQALVMLPLLQAPVLYCHHLQQLRALRRQCLRRALGRGGSCRVIGTMKGLHWWATWTVAQARCEHFVSRVWAKYSWGIFWGACFVRVWCPSCYLWKCWFIAIRTIHSCCCSVAPCAITSTCFSHRVLPCCPIAASGQPILWRLDHWTAWVWHMSWLQVLWTHIIQICQPLLWTQCNPAGHLRVSKQQGKWRHRRGDTQPCSDHFLPSFAIMHLGKGSFSACDTPPQPRSLLGLFKF